MSAEHTYKFNVSMSCGGCSGAVNRVLGKLDGMFLLYLPIHYPLSPLSRRVSSLSSSALCFPSHPPQTYHPYNKLISYFAGVKSYDVSLDTQTATVVTEPTLEYETVLKTIAKTGKKINSGEADGEVKGVEVLA